MLEAVEAMLVIFNQIKGHELNGVNLETLKQFLSLSELIQILVYFITLSPGFKKLFWASKSAINKREWFRPGMVSNQERVIMVGIR